MRHPEHRDALAVISRGGEPGLREVLVTTYYLEMTSRDRLRPRLLNRGGLDLFRVEPPEPELNRFFYRSVGDAWHWVDRLPWTLEDWRDYLNQAGVETWVLRVDGSPAGYFELDSRPGGDVEIVYFGLLEPFTGGGLGAHLLTRAVDRAWDLGARRVWLHTCSLDDPRALSHYLARGFTLYRREQSPRKVPTGSLASRVEKLPNG